MEKTSFSMQLSRYASAYNPSVSATPRQLPLHKGAFGRQSPCDLRPEMLRSDGTRDPSPTPFFSPTPSRPLNLDPVFAWLVKFLTSHHLFLSARGFAEGLRSAAGHRLPLTREVGSRDGGRERFKRYRQPSVNRQSSLPQSFSCENASSLIRGSLSAGAEPVQSLQRFAPLHRLPPYVLPFARRNPTARAKRFAAIIARRKPSHRNFPLSSFHFHLPTTALSFEFIKYILKTKIYYGIPTGVVIK